MVDERLDRGNEQNGVRQRRMKLERCKVTPPRVNVELARHANRLKRSIAEAARLEPSGTLYRVNCLPQRRLAARPSMKASEEEELHVESDAEVDPCGV